MLHRAKLLLVAAARPELEEALVLRAGRGASPANEARAAVEDSEEGAYATLEPFQH